MCRMVSDEERAKNRAYYLKNREKILAAAKERYRTDPALKPRVLETWKVWAKNNPDKLREHHRKYIENNREKVREIHRLADQRRRLQKLHPPKAPKVKPPKVPREKKVKTKVTKEPEPEPEPEIELTPSDYAYLTGKIIFTGPVTLDQSFWA